MYIITNVVGRYSTCQKCIKHQINRRHFHKHNIIITYVKLTKTNISLNECIKFEYHVVSGEDP